jgi:hypothetical protein
VCVIYGVSVVICDKGVCVREREECVCVCVIYGVNVICDRGVCVCYLWCECDL